MQNPAKNKIRGWKFEDILNISKLENECFKDGWTYTMLASAFESDTFSGIVWEEGGEIIGYGGITVAADAADIETIAVAEPYRRAGIGRALIDKLIEIARAKGVKKVFLEVRVSNFVAMQMYLKFGFVGAYARTRYYSNGEDCLVMAKEL